MTSSPAEGGAKSFFDVLELIWFKSVTKGSTIGNGRKNNFIFCITFSV